jgi:hypothetical protein
MAILLVLEDCFAVTWRLCEFNISSDMDRQDFGFGPGTVCTFSVFEKLLNILLDLRRTYTAESILLSD